MGLYRKGGVWWFFKQYKGRKAEGSCGTDNKQVARQYFERKVLPSILDGTFWSEAEAITFSELAKRYMEKYKRQRDPHTIKHLNEYFGNRLSTEITAEMVEDYLRERSDSEKRRPSAATLYKEYSLGRRIYNVAKKRWKRLGITHNPFADVAFRELYTLNSGRVRWFTLEEEKKLLAAAPSEKFRAFIIFALHTGCRRAEILSCTWKDNIDMERRLITVLISKRKPGQLPKYKNIPMSQKLYETLKELSKVRSISGKVFDYDIHEVRYNWDQTCKIAKVTNARFHDCRHTFCSRLAQAGVNLYAIKEMAGHESIKTTEIYAHLCPASLRPAAAVLDDFYKKSDDSPTAEGEALTEAVNS